MKAATICVVRKDGCVVLVYGKQPHAPHYQKLNFPGGKYAAQDCRDPGACARREVRDETGLSTRGHVHVGTVWFHEDDSDEQEGWEVAILTAETDDEVHLCATIFSSEECDARWYSIDQLPIGEMLSTAVDILRWVETGRQFQAHFSAAKQLLDVRWFS